MNRALSVTIGSLVAIALTRKGKEAKATEVPNNKTMPGAKRIGMSDLLSFRRSLL
jgi:hypothetical protein